MDLDVGERLAQRTARLVLLFDIYIGAAWLTGSPNRTDTPTLKPARQVFDFLPGAPARSWGLILLVIALTAAVLIVRGNDRGAKYVFAVLSGYWCFWLLTYVYAAFQKDASLTAPGIVGIVLIGHIRQSLSVIPLVRRR